MTTPCRLHGSPKTQGTNTVPSLHRLQNLDLMDDIPLTYCKETSTNSPTLTTPIIEHNKIMTPRRQTSYHQLHGLNNDLSSMSGGSTSYHQNKSYASTSNGINSVAGNTFCCDAMVGTSSDNVIASNSGIRSHQYSAAQQQQPQPHQQSTSHSHRIPTQQHHSHHNNQAKSDDRCGLRHRWQACPEFHKGEQKKKTKIKIFYDEQT